MGSVFSPKEDGAMPIVQVVDDEDIIQHRPTTDNYTRKSLLPGCRVTVLTFTVPTEKHFL